MLEFVHHKVKILENFNSSFNNVQHLLSERSYQFEGAFEDFQKALLKYFQNTGDSNKESEILRITNLLLTVKKGFDPIKLERITTGKRDLYWGFAYHATEELHRIISEIFIKEQQKLDEAEEMLSNTILNLYQLKILDDKKLKTLNSTQKIGSFWEGLIKQNDSLALIDKKLKIKLINEDIYLILERIFDKFI